MTSVLNNRTLEEMKKFFVTHGTEREYVRSNEEATKLWMEELRRNPESAEDTEPLALIIQMIQRTPKDRYTAIQVVNTIQHFDSHLPFYGICCANDVGTTQKTYQELRPKTFHDDETVTGESIYSYASSVTQTNTVSSANDVVTPTAEEATIKSLASMDFADSHPTLQDLGKEANEPTKTCIPCPLAMHSDARLPPFPSTSKIRKAHQGSSPSILALKKGYDYSKIRWIPIMLIAVKCQPIYAVLSVAFLSRKSEQDNLQ